MGTVPEFVEPMLATAGEIFDSEEHLFEIKWDGIRAICVRDEQGVRLFSRRRNRLDARYPELEALERSPSGTILDGEIVVLRDGIPDFSAALSREQARGPHRIATLARTLPATYVVFDVPFVGGTSLQSRPLRERREELQRVVARIGSPWVVLSDGIIGKGTLLYEQVVSRGLEGVVAKRLDSPYRPGDRSSAWIKIKPKLELHCAVVGYQQDVHQGLRSLILASTSEGGLRYVGKVGSGLTDALRAKLLPMLRERTCESPIVPCPVPKGIWVRPGLYVLVRCTEITKSGTLRAPTFRGLVEED
ncbi:MAG: ATP-dependent DNA ligase [Planctomycetes bacterium]|nr:ATP-dependent DNA ligase [Planctomycetota bacterium]